MAKDIKIGDLVRIIPQDDWDNPSFDADNSNFYKGGRYGVILEPFHKPFSKPYDYNTWKIRLISGNIAVYPTKDLEILARSGEIYRRGAKRS